MIGNTLFFGSATLFALLATWMSGAAAGGPPAVDRGALTLTIPRPPAADEALRLRVRVGPLARGALLVVRAADGTSVGSISPYGARAREKGGAYILPLHLPAQAVADGKVDLRFEIEQKGAKAVRPPTDKELVAVELVFTPITPPVR